MCSYFNAHQVKGEKMKNSLITGLLALSIITTVAPVNAATKHSTDNHSIQHSVHKKTKHLHYKHRLRSAHTSNEMQGIASWYGYESGPRYRRRPKTASGEYFSPKELTAAHKTLPFGTIVEVTNLANNQTVLVKITDRGPFVKGRVIDLSKAAANAIGIKGIQKVSLAIKSFSDKYKAKLITT
jgi:rare lipoprotein A